ncbi:TOBE domain-containing protein [Nitrosophilus alvini]|uniref:TOBE domain-containing protein n=1 Tax=Nitrosophilus alvini TaxID=2714855 RepID=UPI00190D1F3C|nr:TOBE domain-containing protein [Nitrosophilus alvini]
MKNSLDGRLWLGRSEHSFLGKGRIELLEQIERTGSISKAAKAMGMSYKAAWDAVDAMNNLSEKPLVERVTGGKGGGGTVLTPYGKEVVETYKVLQEEHRRFLHNLSLRINEKDGHLRLLKNMAMRVSARNQLSGKVIKIHKGAVNSEVVLQLQGNDTVTATITNDSLRDLDISIDSQVTALFKANAVMLSTDPDIKLGVENRFAGRVERISRGSVNAEVIVALRGGNTICAGLTNAALDELGLKEKMDVVAFCKASSIIIGIY